MKIKQELDEDGLYLWLTPESVSEENLLTSLISKGSKCGRYLSVVDGRWQGGLFLAHPAPPAKPAAKSKGKAKAEAAAPRPEPIKPEAA